MNQESKNSTIIVYRQGTDTINDRISMPENGKQIEQSTHNKHDKQLGKYYRLCIINVKLILTFPEVEPKKIISILNKMKAIEQLARLKQMNNLIKAQSTGTPEEFAMKIRVSRSHLYRLLEELKDYGVPLKYSKSRRTFEYQNNAEVQINYNIQVISDDELKNIEGGICFYPSVLFYETVA